MGQSLELTDHTQFVSWSHLPAQQHGAQQPDTLRPSGSSLAALKKRQRMALKMATGGF